MFTMDYLREVSPELITLDGFDDCIVGVSERNGNSFIVYDSDKIINKLVTVELMTVPDAIEHYEYNILGLHVGDHTPSFMERILQ